MAVGDIVILRAVGRYMDQNVVNAFTYEIATQESSEQLVLAKLCEGWEADYKTEWLARHVADYDLVGLKAFNVVGAAKVPGFESIDEPGTVVGSGLPAFVCRTITMYTASTNYRRRGRVMLSGTAQSMISTTDGSVTTTEQTALDALGSSLQTAITYGNDSFTPGIYNKTLASFEAFVEAKGRPTPSSVTTRRIRQYLIG